MSEDQKIDLNLGNVSVEVLEDLTKRVQDISNSYRAVAQKMGQLYMVADENKVSALTASLDKPMRNASDNEQTFSSLVEALQAAARQGS